MVLFTKAIVLLLAMLGLESDSDILNPQNFPRKLLEIIEVEHVKYPKYSKETPLIYDLELGIFVENPGGIDEDFLNSSSNPKYREEDFLDYLEKADKHERKEEFSPLGRYEAIISKIETMYTAIANMKLIKELDEQLGNIPTGNEENKSLEKLITKCNEIYENTEENSVERAEQIYDLVLEYIKPGKVTDDSISITDLVNGNLGDCNDLVPAYFALLNYYHTRCYMIFGRVEDKDETGHHTWIRVEVGGEEFELDPTWHKLFVPLDDRSDEIKVVYLKEEYMQFKGA